MVENVAERDLSHEELISEAVSRSHKPRLPLAHEAEQRVTPVVDAAPPQPALASRTG
jgi:hypothetical protein